MITHNARVLTIEYLQDVNIKNKKNSKDDNLPKRSNLST